MSNLAAGLTSFNMHLKAFSVRTKSDLVTIQKKVALQVLAGVVNKTPVDTGFARGSWQLDINDWRPPADPSSNNPINAGALALLKLRFGQKVMIGNAAPYITYLEEGSSSQAPEGMLARTLDEVKAQFS